MGRKEKGLNNPANTLNKEECIGVEPKEIQQFMDLEQDKKCLTMFSTLCNHISALQEVKWTLRLGLGFIGLWLVMKELL